jgi:hypothetical protein
MQGYCGVDLATINLIRQQSIWALLNRNCDGGEKTVWQKGTSVSHDWWRLGTVTILLTGGIENCTVSTICVGSGQTADGSILSER